MNERLALLRKMMPEVDRLITGAGSPREVLARVCETLAAVPGYDWVGYYLVDGKEARRLILGPYSGEPTEHTSICFGQGICGQAAESLQTFLVNDVAREDNYLSCSPEVRSEIVIPVFSGCRLVGELDLDSHRRNGFNVDDRRFLEWVAEATSPLVAKLVREGMNV